MRWVSVAFLVGSQLRGKTLRKPRPPSFHIPHFIDNASQTATHKKGPWHNHIFQITESGTWKIGTALTRNPFKTLLLQSDVRHTSVPFLSKSARYCQIDLQEMGDNMKFLKWNEKLLIYLILPGGGPEVITPPVPPPTAVFIINIFLGWGGQASPKCIWLYESSSIWHCAN